ncbi:uncharacterized protein [Rutidosis leptorrhynchoides]|uniref:uncharacterized protein n=1 Tax=Rutidosis leptorrhynchoides TaxID=125765 RepID=UPI003A9926D3
MCPPVFIPFAAELDEYSTDEAIFELLMQLKSGCSLPKNVVSGVDPYQFRPSNHSANIWYFWSGTKMDAENGFWKSTGAACEIYSNSMIIGWRKTLQFYEGRAPDGQKPKWIMQEYTTTDKCSCKPGQDDGGLYKLFLVDDGSIEQPSKSELLVKSIDDVAGPSAMAALSPDLEPLLAISDQSPEQPSTMANRSPEPPSDMANRSPELPIGDYFGDYLELDDLDIPLSRTTSSASSSCITTSMTSDDLFDAHALLRDLADEPVDQGNQDPRIKLNLAVPAKLKEVVVQPASLGSLNKYDESKRSRGQTSKTDPTAQKEPGDRPDEGTSKGFNSSSSPSSSSEGSSKEEKKDRISRRTKKRKMMKYLCFFLAF